MQRSKTLGLMTEIFNKLSSRRFISNTCQIHTSSLPIYYCTKCFQEKNNVMCELCFEKHECPDKNKGQISQWLSKKQQLIGKSLNQVQKQFETHKNLVQGCKIKLKSKQQKTISEFNNEINQAISRGIDANTKKIQESCVKPVTQGSMKALSQNFISQIKLQLGGVTSDISSIANIAQFFQKKPKEIRSQLQNQSRQAINKIAQTYKSIIDSTIKQVLQNIFYEETVKEQKFERKNIQNGFKSKIQQLQKQNKLDSERITELIQSITKVQQKFTTQSQNWRKKSEKFIQNIQKSQKQLELSNLKRKQLEQRLKNFQKNSQEISDKDMKIKKLQQKCQIYQSALEKNAKIQVVKFQTPQQRFNVQELASKLSQLSTQYEVIVSECNKKDKKVAQLSVELNKLQVVLKDRQQKLTKLNQAFMAAKSRSPMSSISGSNRKQFKSP